jgi:hypothetical protein
VTICHATGSATNPFVRISPSASGVVHGHLGHQDARDIVPPFTYKGQSYSQNWDAAGQAMFNNGCAPVQPAPAVAPSNTSVENSSTSNNAVTNNSVTNNSTTNNSVTNNSTTNNSTTNNSATNNATTSGTPSASPSGVLGATHTSSPKVVHHTKAVTLASKPAAATKPAAKPAAGVLGASRSSGTLPFTGLSLWIPALLAMFLVSAGFGIRRFADSKR